MTKSDQEFLVTAFFVVAFSLAYCSTFWIQMVLPRYYPLEHTWKMVNEPGVPSQGWYGKLAFAFWVSGVCCVFGSCFDEGVRSTNVALPTS